MSKKSNKIDYRFESMKICMSCKKLHCSPFDDMCSVGRECRTCAQKHLPPLDDSCKKRVFECLACDKGPHRLPIDDSCPNKLQLCNYCRCLHSPPRGVCCYQRTDDMWNGEDGFIPNIYEHEFEKPRTECCNTPLDFECHHPNCIIVQLTTCCGVPKINGYHTDECIYVPKRKCCGAPERGPHSYSIECEKLMFCKNSPKTKCCGISTEFGFHCDNCPTIPKTECCNNPIDNGFHLLECPGVIKTECCNVPPEYGFHLNECQTTQILIKEVDGYFI